MMCAMSTFPESAAEIRKLAIDLVNFLRQKIRNTHSRPSWGLQNFEALREFSRRRGAHSFPDRKIGEAEFLWDFVAYAPGRGILIAAESEYNKKPSELKHDFEKLLYVRSPIKLMICRMEAESEAEGIQSLLQAFAESTCKEYSPAEIFIVYCVWWGETEEDNRDFAYMLQLEGKPMHRPICNERFERVDFAGQSG